MNANNLQRKIILMTVIQLALLALRIIVVVALCWFSIEAIFYIREYGLKHLIDVIWLGADES